MTSPRTTEPPVARADVVDVAADHVPTPRTTTLRTMNRKNWIRARDPHKTSLKREVANAPNAIKRRAAPS